MVLKSTPAASNLDVPHAGHTLVDYCEAAGIPRLVTDEDLVPIETFLRYGEWFQRRLVPGLERVRVVSVERAGAGGFDLKLDSGEQFAARAVVVATGLTRFAYVPPEFAGHSAGPLAHVSHPSHHADLGVFAGRDLLVVGAGQSALESAVLAAEAGARVRVVARGRGAVAFGAPPWRQPRLRPGSPFGNAWSLHVLSHHPGFYRALPAGARHFGVRRVLGPLGAWWLRERYEGRVTTHEVRAVEDVTRKDEELVVRMRGLDGRTEEVRADHVLATTGYRVDVEALGFLGAGLRAALDTSRGAPRLGAGFRSSLPGLYFTGLPAAASYGPVMRFVCGTEYASPRLAAHLHAAHR